MSDSNHTDRPTANDLRAASLDELIRRAEAAYVAFATAVSPLNDAEATEATDAAWDAWRAVVTEFYTVSNELNARVRALVEEEAPEIYEALVAGDEKEVADAVASFRALPAVARRWIFAFHCDDLFGVIGSDDDLEPTSYTDQAIAFRHAREGREAR